MQRHVKWTSSVSAQGREKRLLPIGSSAFIWRRCNDLKLKVIHASVSRWLLPRVLKICDREVPQGRKEEREDATEPDAVITGVGKLINPQGLRNVKWAQGISVHSLILFKTIYLL